MASALIRFFETQGSQNRSADDFQKGCLALMNAQVSHLNQAYTDMHVKAAVDGMCFEKRLFSGSDVADHQSCIAFARRLTDSWRSANTERSDTGYQDFCKEYTSLALTWRAPARDREGKAPTNQMPDDSATARRQQREDEMGESAATSTVFLCQLVFGVVYYFTVVSKYPKVEGISLPDDHSARKLQAKLEFMSLLDVSFPNCVLSFCCPAARAAHTFDATQTLNYWATFPIMMCVPGMPCCMLFLMNSCTPLNEKLGGEKRGVVMGLLCAWCCQCCVIAQDAESLDLVADAKTNICSFTKAP